MAGKASADHIKILLDLGITNESTDSSFTHAPSNSKSLSQTATCAKRKPERLRTVENHDEKLNKRMLRAVFFSARMKGRLTSHSFLMAASDTSSSST